MGERTIQRAAASILHAVGFPDGLTTTEDAYVARAVELVTSRRRWLTAKRAEWRSRLAASRVCAGYVPAVEALYRSLWRAYCAKESAA